ncbi:MAG TPA: class I SAM-dependent methyltransferase [Streptosporangiaceae bacterium]|nr:class I SAM-dependent methyltransferase [Streptosporangiaceae bacterium]
MSTEPPSSWHEAFAEGYEQWSASMTADIPFYVDLAGRAAGHGPILELAVGNGRVAIPVAQATGQQVIGVDASPAMLAQARENAGRAGVVLDLRQEDMRSFTVAAGLALVYCPYRALLHLPTWGDRRTVFQRVAAHLAPGGRFAWNAFVFSHHVAAARDGKLDQDAPVPVTLHYAIGDNRVDLVRPDGATSSLWWATKNEWLGLIEVAGLEVEALYGGFAGEPFTDDSPEYVFVARKPSQP